jgi:hypothetical protein
LEREGFGVGFGVWGLLFFQDGLYAEIVAGFVFWAFIDHGEVHGVVVIVLRIHNINIKGAEPKV